MINFNNLLYPVFNILTLPLGIVNNVFNFLLEIDVVTDFLNVVAFVLPWDNIIPLISLIIGFFFLRIIISIINTIWNLLPFA